MSGHPDRDPVAHDATDELLAGADADLHAALDDIVDVNAGLTAIVGSSGFERPVSHERPIVRPDVVKDSLQVSSRRPTTTGPSSHRQSLAGVFDQINTLVDLLAKLNRFVLGSKRRRYVRSCAARLVYLRESLEDGVVSREEAETTITEVKRILKKVSMQQSSLCFLLTPLPLVLVSVMALIIISMIYTGRNFGSLSWVPFGIMSLIYPSTSVCGLWKEAKLLKIHNELTSLGRTVDRLFDDADDRDRDWTNLPC